MRGLLPLDTRYSLPLVALACLLAFVFASAAAGFEWQSATPESQGMSSAKLQALQKTLAAKNTTVFLVVRHDRIVQEWYAPGVSMQDRQGTASLAKALVGGLSLAVALTDGKISLEDPAAKFVPQWQNDPLKSRIKIRHLGSHTSGLDDAEADDQPHEKLTGWKGDFWKRLQPPQDAFTIARDQTPMVFTPGEKIEYSNPGIGMMTYCVTAALSNSPQRDIRTLLAERVLRPIGVADAEWSVGYGQTFTVDGLPLVCSWGGGAFMPRATARLGRLVLREGDWDGRRILSREAVRQVTTDAGLPGHCGMGWWSNGGGRYSDLPRDAKWGAGAGDKLLLVIPSLDLIMVRCGNTLTPSPGEPPMRSDDVFTRYHDYRAHILFEPLVQAVNDRSARLEAPYPPSQVIGEVRWAPQETIVRRAAGSDNWPLTWADDDGLYTAYGDGNGFEPFLPEKLGLGFARISGSPPAFSGVNVRSPSIEQKGHGAAGRKASGLLCVDGTLYLWARNATNSQLAWSGDHGQTWTWSDWKFTTSFGCPSFLNFGRNNAGARDEFAYVYSPDTNSAYRTSDQLVLARAPAARLRERDAWEFFAGIDSAGHPRWTRDIAARSAVFRHPGHCYRTSVVWNAPLRRYLLVQPVPGPSSRDQTGNLDTRVSGGLAIYDAPEPWGPWTTAYFTDQWDVGPGDSASFPTRWISANGQTLYLVFSGEDSFAVREANLVPARNSTASAARP